MKQNLIEEILRFNLLSKYDNTKTLSEQGSADINMDRINREQLAQAPKSVVTTAPFSNFPCVPKNPKAKPYKLPDGTLTYEIDGVYYYGGGRKKLANGTMANFTCNDPEFKPVKEFANYPCVAKHPDAKINDRGDGTVDYVINSVTYYGNGRKRLANGTMANFTCNDPEFKNVNAGVKKQTQKPVAIPTELKDTKGVKAFQDWLDTNAPGWADGYKDNKLNQGKQYAGFQSGGYGTFGKRTQKAWNNPTYKDQYLKSLTTGEDVSISEVPATTNPNEY